MLAAMQHVAGHGAHAGYAIVELLQIAFVDDSCLDPAGYLLTKSWLLCSEEAGALVTLPGGFGCAAATGASTPAYPPTFFKQINVMAGLRQCFGAGQSGDARTHDGNTGRVRSNAGHAEPLCLANKQLVQNENM